MIRWLGLREDHYYIMVKFNLKWHIADALCRLDYVKLRAFKATADKHITPADIKSFSNAVSIKVNMDNLINETEPPIQTWDAMWLKKLSI